MVLFRIIVERSRVLLVKYLNGFLMLIGLFLALLVLNNGIRVVHLERRLSCREALGNFRSNLKILRDLSTLVKVTLRVDIAAIRVHKIPVSIVLSDKLSLLRCSCCLFYLRLLLILGSLFRAIYSRRFCFYLI